MRVRLAIEGATTAFDSAFVPSPDSLGCCILARFNWEYWCSRARVYSEAGGLDRDMAAADVLADYEARIAALERLVGKLALENEFLKGASRHVRQPRSAGTSVLAGPAVSPSQTDVG